MKKILIWVMLLWSMPVGAWTTSNLYTTAVDAQIRSMLDLKPDDYYEIIEHTESCTVVKVYDRKHNVFLWRIVALVLTELLPDMAGGVCKLVGGNPDVCNAVHGVTSLLIGMKGTVGRRVNRAGSLGYRAVAQRRRSRAVIEDIASEQIANQVKALFQEYENPRDCNKGIPWESINDLNETITVNTVGSPLTYSSTLNFTVINPVQEPLNMAWGTVEPDGESLGWNYVNIASSTETSYHSHDNINGEYYIWISSGNNNLYYKVFGGNKYVLYYNYHVNRWELNQIKSAP